MVAGLTTFMTMAYIIFVNPAILGTQGTGLPVSGVFFATCVAAAVACIAMGLVANFPLALASGLGLNAIVTYTLILGLGLSWQQAMAVIVVEGVLVTVLVLTNLREAVLNAIPMSLKFAIAVGIGLFIAFIGLKNAGLVVPNADDLPGPRRPHAGSRLASRFRAHTHARARGAGPQGRHHCRDIGYGRRRHDLRDRAASQGIVDFSFDTSTVGGGVLAVPEVLQLSLLPVIFALFMTDFFDTMGTMIGVAQEGKLIDEEGRVPQAKRILLVDGLAAVLGGAVGASSVTSYIESGSGVAEGGRTGLTSVVVGLLFLVALPFSPLISVFGGSIPIPDPAGGARSLSSHPVPPRP